MESSSLKQTLNCRGNFSMSMVSNVQKGLLLVYFLFLKRICTNILHVLIMRMPLSFIFLQMSVRKKEKNVLYI